MDEKYLVSDDFLTTTHGRLGCVTCHGGNDGSLDKVEAHVGVIGNPSSQAAEKCGTCHAEAVAGQKNSLHANLTGYRTVLEARGGNMASGALVTAYDNHCAKCHTTCGQCHVSRPANIQGGLLDGHDFKKSPPLRDACLSCHATRVGPEYLGQNAGVPGDVHWNRGGMTCVRCHSTELHGGSEPRAHRYDGDTTQCLDCHPDAAPGRSSVQQHNVHGDQLACQVCHSGPYKNCFSCHVGIDNQGVKYFTTEEPTIDFKIGLNPLQSPERPYKYVTVRHAPIDPESFAFYGENLLPEFDNVPTWKYATPHNIQRNTPQNESCNSCHGNADLFLQEKDVAPALREANKGVIVPQIPARLGQ